MKENNQEQSFESKIPQKEGFRGKWKNLLYVFLIIPWTMAVVILFGTISYFAGNLIASSAPVVTTTNSNLIVILEGRDLDPRDAAVKVLRSCLTFSLLIALIFIITGVVCRRKNQESKWGKRFILLGFIHIASAMLIFLMVNIAFYHPSHDILQ